MQEFSLLSWSIHEKLNELEENNGCNIFSVEISGNHAEISFETVKDCTIVVAVYDENGEKMFASGSAELTADDIFANIIIETDSMPDY